MEVKMASQTTRMLLGYSLVGLAGPVWVFLWPYFGAWTLLALITLVLASWLLSARKNNTATDPEAYTDADVEEELARDNDFKGIALEEELRLNPAYSMVAGNVHYKISSTDQNPPSL